jgi:hypothetical protein
MARLLKISGRSVLLLLLLSVLHLACNPDQGPNSRFRIENKLNTSIVCMPGYNYPNLNMNFTGKQALLEKLGQYELKSGENKLTDTLGLCNKEVWDKTIKHSMLMIFVLDKEKLIKATRLEDALLERYYFTYEQLLKCNGVITLR